MFLNDIDDALVEFVFEREIDPFLHMRDNDQRAHRRGQILVRVALEVHVFGEIIGLHQFPDIVEIRADAAESGVRADRFRGGFGQVRDHQAVMIGARRFDGHAAQERMVQIRRFQPRNVGRDLEQRFEHRNHAADDHGGDNPVADGKGALQSDHRPIVCRGRKEIDRADETEGEGQNPDGQPRHQARRESVCCDDALAGSDRQR